MTTAANDNQLPDWPRGLSRILAAAYIGISPTLFDALVKEGRMPKPKHINSRLVWDRRSVDLHFDALEGDRTGANIKSDIFEFAA